ncbi:PAS domain S-box protein [Actinoplanes sp. HUAS TT8]|uniref:PAS domain-containing hybrid sensor histidine kinase/response regulator n=1 Tax=Actinoplanes sp. HUAS TT8 TaxID=3447453 RepID=UPI003F5271C7
MAGTAPEGHGRGPLWIAAFAATSAVAIGVVALIGYATGAPVLTSWNLGWPPMPPITAAESVLAGSGLLLILPGESRRVIHRLGRAAGGVVAATAATVLVEYVTGARLIDTVLFPHRIRTWAINEVPGRPSLHMAVGFLFAGLCLVVLDTTMTRTTFVGRLLVPAVLLIGTMASLGDLYGAVYIKTGSATLPGTSGTASTALLALGVGLTLSRPDRPPGHVFTGRCPGGRAIRRLAPSVAAILIAAVLLTAVGQSSAPIDSGLAVTVATGMVITCLYLLFLRTGAAMEAADRKLRDERDYIRSVLDSLREGVLTAAADGQILHATPRWCEITGYAASDVLGLRPPYPWWPPERRSMMAELMDTTLCTPGAREIDTCIVRADGTRVDVLLTVCPVPARDGQVMRLVTYRDLTERKAAEAERQRMSDQVDHFFEMSGDLLCIVDRDGYFQRLNPAWERTLGFTLGELMSRPYLEFVHPDDAERTYADARQMLAAGVRLANFENRFQCRDGSYCWLSWSATLADGGAMIYGVGRDTTAQREADHNQAFLASIVNSTDDAVIGKTLDGTIISWNAAAERMYGYSAAEAIGRSIRILTLPGQFDEIEKILAGLRAGGPVVHRESLRRRADGSRLRVSLTISPIRDRNGSIVGAASIARDVTAHAAAEQRFRRLVQTAPDAMIIVDGGGRIVLANDQTGRLFGYPSDDLVGVSVEQLMPASARHRHVRHRKAYVAAPHNLLMGSGMELSGLRRDGTEFPIEISLAPLQTDEGVMISGAIRDISRRREVEQALASARDDALAAAKLKSQFVAMVSHEIRTPMNGVIGLAGLLLNTPLNSEQLRYAEAIGTSGRALLGIINDILDFSKIEAGKITIVRADFDLVEVLDTVTDIAAEAACGKDVDVICYYPPHLPETVHGDGGRLRQTLLNLVGNAVKFTPRGQVILRAEPAADAIMFTVTDTGLGIAAHDLPRLFEPFVQAEATTSRQYGGTGLGLTISRQFIELMGGELTAQSTLGQGSMFAFTIPLPETVAAGSADRPTGDSRRLLVIDGHPVRRRLIVEHARSWGMTVTEAADGRQALNRAGRPAPELVVLDESLLRGDEQLTAAMGAVATIGECHLALLASPNRGAEATALADLGAHLLIKPVGPRRLRAYLNGARTPGTDPGDPDTTTGRPGPGPRDRVRILLAEDNEINQLVAEDLLDLLGFDCDLAQNGEEVLRLTGTHSYRAILMDCHMPTMDGYQATAALRAREAPGQHIPIIAMTAGALAEDREQCFAAGMDDYLAKPIDTTALRAALERWTSDLTSPAEQL